MDDRRAQLIEVGLAHFATRSYDEIAIDELAKAAGISKGLLYHYFPSKRDYYVAVLDHAARQLLAETTPPARELSEAERLRRGLQTYLDFVERHGPAFAVLMRGGIGADPDVAAILERTRVAFVERILEDLPGEMDSPLVRLALRGWIGFVEAVALEWILRHPVAKDEVIDLITAAFFASLQGAAGVERA